MAAQSVFDLLALSPPGWGGNLLRGAWNTIQIALLAYGVGICLGMVGAMAKLSGSKPAYWAAETYTTLVRAVPDLLLIMLLYYAGTTALNQLLAGYGISAIKVSGFAAGVGVLGFVQGAYHTEVLRAAIQAVPVGQIEAAKAFGMSPFMRWRRVLIPAMLPFALPGMANLWLVLTKATALLAVVGYGELTLETRQAAGGTKAYFLFYAAAMAIYLAITLVSTRFFSWLENRMRRGQRRHA
jgi:polar amino acid transport system permease protein